MSEEAQEKEGPKKKSKLPVMIALLAVFAGGGYFGLKMKGGGKHEKPPVKLGEIEALDKEFIVNVGGKTTLYLMAEVALHFKEGFKKEEFDKSLPAVKDAIRGILESKSYNQMSTPEGKIRIKREIAGAINVLLVSLAPEDPKSKREGEHKKAEMDAKPKQPEKPKLPEHPDWDSQEGPVLKVYFTRFAVQ